MVKQEQEERKVEKKEPDLRREKKEFDAMMLAQDLRRGVR
jgi:hypothetical protein